MEEGEYLLVAVHFILPTTKNPEWEDGVTWSRVQISTIHPLCNDHQEEKEGKKTSIGRTVISWGTESIQEVSYTWNWKKEKRKECVY